MLGHGDVAGPRARAWELPNSDEAIHFNLELLLLVKGPKEIKAAAQVRIS